MVLHFAFLESFVRGGKEEGRKERREGEREHSHLFVGKSSHGNKQITCVITVQK